MLRSLPVGAALAALLVLASTARADETTGTWTGLLELRSQYYWETSTRVVAPELRLRLDSPEGTRVEGSYLVDAITSASIAAGAQEDIRFTEIRNQGTLGISRELETGDAFLRLGTTGRVSHEPDYLATGLTAFGALSLNRRATVLTLSLTYIHDHVGSVLRGGEPRVDPSTGRDLSDRGRQGTLEGVVAGLTWSQVLTPVSTFVLGYQMVANWGYLQNPYRRARVAGTLAREEHPNQRLRHTLHGRYAHFFPGTKTAVHLMLRLYADDWSIAALTPEIRAYQMLGRGAMLRLRYRYYTQTLSDFAPPLDGYDGSEQFVTADGKMVGIDSHLGGVQLRVALSFLRRTPLLAFLERAWVDLTFDVWLRDYNRENVGWGRDAVIATAGLRTPF